MILIKKSPYLLFKLGMLSEIPDWYKATGCDYYQLGYGYIHIMKRNYCDRRGHREQNDAESAEWMLQLHRDNDFPFKVEIKDYLTSQIVYQITPLS